MCLGRQIETEMDTEARGERGTSQSHSRHKKGHMTNIYLMDSDEEVIVNSVKNHEELHERRLLNILKNKQGRNVFERDSQAVRHNVQDLV